MWLETDPECGVFLTHAVTATCTGNRVEGIKEVQPSATMSRNDVGVSF